jgi:hypothetical protein
MKEVVINVAAQAKAIRKICAGYTEPYNNYRYKELIEEFSVNPTISMLLHLIGEALIREEKELESEIQKDLAGKYALVYFDNYRYCTTNSREMIIALAKLMGW